MMNRWLPQLVTWHYIRMPVFALLAGLVTWGVIHFLPLIPSGKPATISLAGKATPEANVVIKVNGKTYGHIKLSSRTTVQSVQASGKPIEELQFKLEGTDGTRVLLSELTIAYGSTVVRQWRGESLGLLRTDDLAHLRSDEEGLKTRLTSDVGNLADRPIPALVAPGPLGTVQKWLIGASRAPTTLNLWVIALLLGLTVVLTQVRRMPFLTVVIGLCVWLLAVVSYELVPELINPNPPVGVAIGAASYFGTPYAGQQAAAWVSLALILVGAVLLSSDKLRLRLRTAIGSTQNLKKSGDVIESTNGRSRDALAFSRRGVFAVAVGWLVIALTLIPTLGPASLDFVLPSWDVGNITAWGIFQQTGLEPARDFWFPYGNQWLFSGIPMGPVWSWLTNITMLAIMAWSLWRLSGRRSGRTVICLVAVALISTLTVGSTLNLTEFGSDVWRNLSALLVATTYAALGPARHQRLHRDHLIFFAACFIAIFIGADQLVFGLAGACFVLFGELLFGTHKVRPLRRFFNLLIDAVPVVVAIVLMLLIWLAWGSADANLSFLLNLKDFSAFVSLNQMTEGALVNLSFAPNTNTLVVVLPFLLLFAGLVQGYLGRQSTSYGVSQLLLAATGPSILLLQRNLARPNDLMFYFPLLALTLAVILLWNRRVRFATILTGAFIGAVVAGLQYEGKLNDYLSDIWHMPSRVVNSARYLTDQDEVSYARKLSVDPKRFSAWPERRIADDLRAATNSQKPSFAVLGDASMLYVWFGQRPLPHVNLYDTAPIYEQKQMIDSLRQDKPKYLVWRRDTFAVDAVPYVVRDPLLFTYAIDHYVPIKLGRAKCSAANQSCGTSDILTLRRPDQSIPINYWRSRLGTSVDLGFIPSYAKLPGKQSCSKGKDCVRYAVIRGHPVNSDQPIELEISGRGKKYRVLMQARSGTDHYTIRLDRLWFWKLLGSQPKLTMLTPGISVKQQVVPENGRLY